MDTAFLGTTAAAERLAVALLVGLAVGTEREWSAPRDAGPSRYAGLRTFLLFGLLGGVGGLLVAAGAVAPAAAVLAAGLAFHLVAYAAAARRPERPAEATTEAAGLAVVALGALAGMGASALAGGAAAVMVFALGEKQRLHGLVARIGTAEMHAALEFLVLALVVLPLLPPGPIPELFGVRPRVLWSIVLLLSGINFAGYVARRVAGSGRGYGAIGLLAGLLSSTALTFQFSRLSRHEPEHAHGLGLGVLAACAVLPLRLVVVSLALNPPVALALLPTALPLAAIGFLFARPLLREAPADTSAAPGARNPLRLGSALQLAVGFEVAFLLIGWARRTWGTVGLAGSSVLFGVADLDALTVSLNRMPNGPGMVSAAALGVTIGLTTNTLVKLGIVALLGERHFRRHALPGLLASLGFLGAALWWRW